MRVAALDCGTNSLRLLVADLPAEPDRPAVDVHREMRVVRLGEGVDRTGELAPQALERVRAALVGHAATCRRLGVEAVRMVATSATRDARNRDEFVRLVRDVLGVAPEVVSGDEEAALSYAGATRGLDPAGAPFLVVDVGGGSTEFVLGGAGGVRAALSVDIGCVRLTERHLHDDPPTQAQVAAARADVAAALARVRAVVPVEQARTLLGLAGSVTTVAALALGLEAYDPARIHLARVSAGSVHEVADRLLRSTVAERLALPVMHPGRADVIAAGALVVDAVVASLTPLEMVASEADILDGIAWSIPGRRTTVSPAPGVPTGQDEAAPHHAPAHDDASPTGRTGAP